MKEKELLDAVVERARFCGWRVARFPAVPVKYPGQPVRWVTPAQADGKGWLDLLLLRERPLAVELKAAGDSADRRLPPDQQAWFDAWRIAGVRAFVWRPEDLDNGTIDAELSLVLRRDPIVRTEDHPGPPPEPRISKPPATEIRG